MKKVTLAVLLFATSTAFAALPPLAQSEREIQAILESPQTYNLLGGAYPIDQIIRCENGYLLATANQKLMVEVHYVRAGKRGARRVRTEILASNKTIKLLKEQAMNR